LLQKGYGFETSRKDTEEEYARRKEERDVMVTSLGQQLAEAAGISHSGARPT
jgi:hypothetical protein